MIHIFLLFYFYGCMKNIDFLIRSAYSLFAEVFQQTGRVGPLEQEQPQPRGRHRHIRRGKAGGATTELGT